MSAVDFTMRQLMEAGVHFGHRVHLWEPKMAPYIYGSRSGIHIIDLSQTVPLLRRALTEARDIAASGGRVLFVGTKRQACENVADAATRCAQYYMNHRWLGGTLTNWETVSRSIRRLRDLDELLERADESGLTKKELLQLTRERDKYQRTLGGIRNMGGLPNLVVVIDTRREAIAIREARKLGIPVIAVIDSNCDPQDADFPIPGNDDASRSVKLYCDLLASAVLEGLDRAAGQPDDISEKTPDEEAPAVVEDAPQDEDLLADDRQIVDDKPDIVAAGAGETAS